MTCCLAGKFSAGVAALETLLAAPVVILLGLSALQWGLLFHAHQAISHAVHAGARAGSLEHAGAAAIERGLADGLSPWLFGSRSLEEHQANLNRSRLELAHGIARGWIRWQQLSPGVQSFVDWAVPARDQLGDIIAGEREIPNDNLGVVARAGSPTTGISGYRYGAAVGAASGQTLADANLLKIELVYAVPLSVPLVGRFAVWIMQSLDQCSDREVSQPRLGLLEFGRANAAPPLPSAWRCPFYRGTDSQGRNAQRWPVKVAATIRMQSPARYSSQMSNDAGKALSAGSLGPGEVDSAALFEPISPGAQNPGGASAIEDGSFDRAPGFLEFGGQRLPAPPLMCTGA